MPATSRTRKKDAIALLKQDHKNLRQLLRKLESAEEPGERVELLTEVENEVKVHTQIVETIFYPALQQAPQSEEDEERNAGLKGVAQIGDATLNTTVIPSSRGGVDAPSRNIAEGIL